MEKLTKEQEDLLYDSLDQTFFQMKGVESCLELDREGKEQYLFNVGFLRKILLNYSKQCSPDIQPEIKQGELTLLHVQTNEVIYKGLVEIVKSKGGSVYLEQYSNTIIDKVREWSRKNMFLEIDQEQGEHLLSERLFTKDFKMVVSYQGKVLKNDLDYHKIFKPKKENGN